MRDDDTPPPPRTSGILRDLAAGLPGERVTLGEIDAALADRAFGLLMLVFALPNTLPSLPGMSAVLGLPLLMLALQLAGGWSRPWLPRWLAGRSLPVRDFSRFVDLATPWLQRIERVLTPRLPQFTAPVVERWVVGVMAVLLATAIVLPIPFGNIPPAIGVSLLALGLLERDGAAVLAGLAVGVVSLAVVGAVLLGLGAAGLAILGSL